MTVSIFFFIFFVSLNKYCYENVICLELTVFSQVALDWPFVIPDIFWQNVGWENLLQDPHSNTPTRLNPGQIFNPSPALVMSQGLWKYFLALYITNVLLKQIAVWQSNCSPGWVPHISQICTFCLAMVTSTVLFQLMRILHVTQMHVWVTHS